MPAGKLRPKKKVMAGMRDMVIFEACWGGSVAWAGLGSGRTGIAMRSWIKVRIPASSGRILVGSGCARFIQRKVVFGSWVSLGTKGKMSALIFARLLLSIVENEKKRA